MKIGQIVYNLIGLDGYLISTKDDLSGTISSEDSSYESLRIKISKDLVSKIGAKIAHLGVQAPIGTVMTVNGKRIQIGRSGTYELNELGFEVESLSFEDGIENLIVDYVTVSK